MITLNNGHQMQHISINSMVDIRISLMYDIAMKSASIGVEHNGKDCVGRHGEKGDKGQDPSF